MSCNLQSVLNHSQAKQAWQDRHDTYKLETNGATKLQALLDGKHSKGIQNMSMQPHSGPRHHVLYAEALQKDSVIPTRPSLESHCLLCHSKELV